MEGITRPELEDWEVLVSFLPEGWRAKAKELGALSRCRKVRSADVLLRLLLIHLADGCSLRETVALARADGIADLSDVALMKRLIASSEWFRWLCTAMMAEWGLGRPQRASACERRVVAVDGATIREPGPTGSSWRLHYAIDLHDFRCLEAHVTGYRSPESLQHFQIERGDVFIADRGYGRAAGIRHVVDRDADIVVRIHHRSMRLSDEDGGRFSVLGGLRRLQGTQLGDWRVRVLGDDGWSHPARVCAVRMSRTAAGKARRRAKLKAQKGGYQPSEEALESAGYVTALTTLPREHATPTTVLEMCRERWQLGLALEQMKSIMALGHLYRASHGSAEAWIQGKLFVALLVEAMKRAGELHSPWGYALR